MADGNPRIRDIDPAIPTDGDRRFEYAEDINRILNRKVRSLGYLRKSSDMRDIHAAMRAGDAKAQLKNDIFVDRAPKNILVSIWSF